MSVYLCRRDVTVAKHTLNTSKISAIHEQVGREAVPHGVRADVFCDTGKLSVLVHHALNAARGEASKVATGRRLDVTAIADEKRYKAILPCVEVTIYPVGCRLTNEYWAIFLAFSANHKLTPFCVDVVTVKVY